MRKIALFVAALLFMAVPAMAVPSNVTISCGHTVVGDVNWITVTYATDNNLIRAFGLDITLYPEEANIIQVVVLDPNYRIFPGQISIVDGDVNDYYTCYDPCDIGDSNLAVELASLYTTDTNYIGDADAGYGMMPQLAGNLLKFAYINASFYYIDVNVRRGGIVMEDPYETPDINLLCGFYCPVPDLIGMTSAAAQAAILAANFTVGTITEVDGGLAPIGTVVAQNPTDGGNWVGCGTPINISVAAYCMKSVTTPASIRTDWDTWGRPKCWCYQRQCRGDADGSVMGVYWVASADLNLFKQVYLNPTALQAIPNGICCDFDHQPIGIYRIGPGDLAILKQHYLKIPAQVPPCSLSPNYNFWCTPTSTTLGCP